MAIASKVAELLSQGARVDVKGDAGFTPLLAAAQEGHIELCKQLLQTSKAAGAWKQGKMKKCTDTLHHPV